MTINAMKLFHVTFVLSVALIVGGFFCPPMGVIDGSVLTAVGLLLMFATVDKIPEAIKAGKSIKLQKGDLTIEAGRSEKEAPSLDNARDPQH